MFRARTQGLAFLVLDLQKSLQRPPNKVATKNICANFQNSHQGAVPPHLRRTNLDCASNVVCILGSVLEIKKNGGGDGSVL